MTNLMADILEFHVKFGLFYGDKPRFIPKDISDFRIGFMQEELDEYVEARRNTDIVGQFDALIDLVYVALGTVHLHGFDFNEGWNRVHEANMKKVRGISERSKFDVVKPEGWKPANLEDLV